MNKETAQEVRDYALEAIRNLSSGLNAALGKCDEEELEALKKAIGMSIIKIDNELLGLIYSKYPELDDLKD